MCPHIMLNVLYIANTQSLLLELDIWLSGYTKKNCLDMWDSLMNQRTSHYDKNRH